MVSALCLHDQQHHVNFVHLSPPVSKTTVKSFKRFIHAVTNVSHSLNVLLDHFNKNQLLSRVVNRWSIMC